MEHNINMNNKLGTRSKLSIKIFIGFCGLSLIFFNFFV